MKLVALAGGVGGAKLADGLAALIPADSMTVVVNTGDDFEHFGLHISPDLDTVCYTLAGMANRREGWGRSGESWKAITGVEGLGGPAWFRLGDRDLATHLERTRRLRDGERLSAITRAFCTAWGVRHEILPMTDGSVRTMVDAVEHGEIEFQEYFVRLQCSPTVRGFRFEGVETATPAAGVLEAIRDCSFVVICPSNPWVSIGPILAVPGIGDALAGKRVLAVSPIIGGRAVKGPAGKMLSELGYEVSAIAIAEHYRGIATDFVLDQVDAALEPRVREIGMRPLVTDTLIRSRAGRRRLARDVLDSLGFRS